MAIVILAEIAANHQHAIRRLNNHGVHVAVRAIPEIDRRIRRAGRHQAGDVIARDAIGLGELADQNNPVVRLQRNAFNRVARSRATKLVSTVPSVFKRTT